MKFIKEAIGPILLLLGLLGFLFFWSMYASAFWDKSTHGIGFAETPFLQKIRLGLGILLFLVWFIASIGIIREYFKRK